MEVIPPLSSNLVPTIPVLILAWSSSQVPYTSKVEDFFSMLNLDCTPLCFPNLSKEKRSVMVSILQGRPIFRPRGLEVIDTLDRLLTFPFNVSTLTYPSYQCHLAIIRQMAF
jgi:hypothetical protein